MSNFKELKTNSHGSKGDYRSRAVGTTRHLTRIITFLSDVDYANKTRIRDFCCSDNKRIKDALLWLVNHRIVLKKNVQNKKRKERFDAYYINPKYFELFKND